MTTKLELDLDILLPEVAHEGDRCVQRLRDLLEAKTGVDATHWVELPAGGPSRLCVHVDPTKFSVQEVRQLAHRAGAQLQAKYGHVLFTLPSLNARRARRIRSQLSNLTGVLEAAVAPDGVIRLEFDRDQTDEATLLAKSNDLIGVVAEPEHAGHAHGGVFGNNTELIFVGLCGITLLSGWLFQSFTDAPSALGQLLLIAAYFFGGWFTFREAIEHLRAGRFEIDTLMLVAAIGAAILGEWAEGALLLFLFGLGHALEAYAMGRAKRAIESLAELTPDTASVLRNGEVSEVPLDALVIGDIVIVRPNERLPADGFVVKGDSSINQAPITGESVPVDKHPVADIGKAALNAEVVDASSRVFAGSINGSGALEIYVARLSSQSTLARVVDMVREAQTNQSPTQQFTDRFERIFTPSVLIGAVLVLVFGLMMDANMGESFYRMFAFLVAASPCALAIATPSAVLSGIARAARGGVLMKGGGPLENLGRLQAIAFDKTGTLTEGKPELVDVVPFGSADNTELLRIAIAVESLSDHPLAAAVVRAGEDMLPSTPIPAAVGLRSLTGRGVQAQVEGLDTFIGKDDLFEEIDGPPLPDELRALVEGLEMDGRTTMIVRHGGRYLGVMGLMDTPRADAAAVIAELRILGIRRMLMISGDNQRVADAVAREVGLDEARGDLMPDDKVATIKQLRKEAPVAMVGDGVNDAPAMANATVGIAMGAAGSDVALETADVALMSDDLRHLPFAVGLSRASSRIIRQNLWFSLGMVAVLVPSTLFGLSIGAAVLMHEGSTVLVVFNALRLLAYNKPVPVGTANDR